MLSRIKDCYEKNDKCYITLELETDFLRQYHELRDLPLDITIKKHREKRSISANAYFHMLCNQIARKQSISDEECKRKLVLDYGAIASDERDGNFMVILPETVNPLDYYPYCKWIEQRTIDAQKFNCYILYKQTHLMNSEEMAKLIDGALYEAQEMGIQTERITYE